MDKTIVDMYFSPTNSSKHTGKIISDEVAKILGYGREGSNCTVPASRRKCITLNADDILVCSFPVYSGRMPEPFSRWFANLSCNGCRVIPVAVYGNRAFDDALLEAADLIKESGGKVIAAIAAIAQHTFDPHIAQGRPDKADTEILKAFATEIAKKILSGNDHEPEIPGNRPFRMPPTLPRISPVTNDKCNYCGICVKKCPMGIIDSRDEHIIGEGCILCSACVKYCPQNAKALPEPFLKSIQEKLSKLAAGKKEPQLFIDLGDASTGR